MHPIPKSSDCLAVRRSLTDARIHRPCRGRREGYRPMRRIMLAPALLIAAGCSATATPPAVELRTIEIRVPVPQPCLSAEQIPAEPPRIASQLNGDARHDLDLVAAS